eukprot:762537_1
MALLNLNEDDIKRWNRRSQVKGMMMELFRGLTVMITFIFTKAEKEVRTGDSPDDIAMEVNRLLAEFEGSVSQAIEKGISINQIARLAGAWLQRSVLMAYTFVAEKDLAMRHVYKHPTVNETLARQCDFQALWDWENQEFGQTLVTVRAAVTHESAMARFDAAFQQISAQEINPATRMPSGKSYEFQELIKWALSDDHGRDRPKYYPLMLQWAKINWKQVTITCSMQTLPKDNRQFRRHHLFHAATLAFNLGLDWDWPKEVDLNFYFTKRNEDYMVVESSDAIKHGGRGESTVIKVEKSGAEFRQKRKSKEKNLDVSEAILTADQRDELDLFLEKTSQGMEVLKHGRSGLSRKPIPTHIQVSRPQKGEAMLVYWKTGKKEIKQKFVDFMEIDDINSGRTTDDLKKAGKNVPEDCLFSIKRANGESLSFQTMTH